MQSTELISPIKIPPFTHQVVVEIILFIYLIIFFFIFSFHRSDYLRIADGSNNTIGTYCGNQTGKSVRVVGSIASLTFHTDGSVQSRGFELSFSFFRQSPGELNTVSTIFAVLMYSCYSHQRKYSDFFSIASPIPKRSVGHHLRYWYILYHRFITLALVVKNIFQFRRITQFCTKGKVELN